MTIAQICYDLNYVLRISRSKPACWLSLFLDLSGGLAVPFWTNLLAFVVAYTVVYSRPINIFHRYYLFSIYGTVIPILVAICAVSIPNVISDDDNGEDDCHYYDNAYGNAIYNLYYWGRLSAIFFTVILCFISFFRLRSLQSTIMDTINNYSVNSQPNRSTTTTATTIHITRGSLAAANLTNSYSNNSNNSNSNNNNNNITGTAPQQQQQQPPNATRLVFTTVARMNYYAIAQILCRSGAAWNEWNYGAASNFSSSMAAAVCSPSTGICNFLIFLIMQPNAYANFKAIICCRMKFGLGRLGGGGAMGGGLGGSNRKISKGSSSMSPCSQHSSRGDSLFNDEDEDGIHGGLAFDDQSGIHTATNDDVSTINHLFARESNLYEDPSQNI